MNHESDRASPFRLRVVAAARDQLLKRGVARFELAAVAANAGEDPALIEAMWPHRDALLTQVWQRYLDWKTCGPGSGDLAGDLNSLAAGIANSVITEPDRAVLFSALPHDGTTDFTDVRAGFWTAQFNRAGRILERATERGQIRPDLNVAHAIRMIVTALFYDPLYKDAPLRLDYVASVIDVFLHGVVRGGVTQVPLDEKDRFRELLPVSVGVDESAGRHDSHASSTAAVRQLILDNAVEEHMERGTDGFTMGDVVRRAGVAPAIMQCKWNNRRDLLLASALQATDRFMLAPDTGSLSGDLMAYAESKAALVATERGRRYFMTLLPRGRTKAIEPLRELWLTRFDQMAEIFRRASRRGDLRAVVNAQHAIRSFSCGLYFDTLFNDLPMEPGYAVNTVDIFLNGVLPR